MLDALGKISYPAFSRYVLTFCDLRYFLYILHFVNIFFILMTLLQFKLFEKIWIFIFFSFFIEVRADLLIVQVY